MYNTFVGTYLNTLTTDEQLFFGTLDNQMQVVGTGFSSIKYDAAATSASFQNVIYESSSAYSSGISKGTSNYGIVMKYDPTSLTITWLNGYSESNEVFFCSALHMHSSTRLLSVCTGYQNMYSTTLLWLDPTDGSISD